MLKLLTTASIMAASIFSFSGNAKAGVFTYSGTLAGSPVYHRPSYTNPFTPAFNCNNCGFQSQAVSVSQSGSYNFLVTSSSFSDHVGQLYSNNFNPTNPMTNFNGPLSYATYLTGNSKTLSLIAGIQYYWVTATDFGFARACGAGCNFTTRISGPGMIAANVPEPATWAMLIVGFGLVGAVARRRKGAIAA